MRKIKGYHQFISENNILGSSAVSALSKFISPSSPKPSSPEVSYPEKEEIKNTVSTTTEQLRDPGDITISGEYNLPPSIPNRGDALHSFNRRKSDKWGGYILTGPNDPEKEIPKKFKNYIKFNQGVGINETLKSLKEKGVNPDIKSLSVNVLSSSKVQWGAVIGKSKDGTAWVGVTTVGSAGGNADSRALGQVDSMKKKKPEAKMWELVLDLNITSPMKIRQFFYKYK